MKTKTSFSHSKWWCSQDITELYQSSWFNRVNQISVILFSQFVFSATNFIDLTEHLMYLLYSPVHVIIGQCHKFWSEGKICKLDTWGVILLLYFGVVFLFFMTDSVVTCDLKCCLLLRSVVLLAISVNSFSLSIFGSLFCSMFTVTMVRFSVSDNYLLATLKDSSRILMEIYFRLILSPLVHSLRISST